MGAECEEELQASQEPQLEPRTQCVPDHVHHAQDWQDGEVHGGPGGVWTPGSLSVS